MASVGEGVPPWQHADTGDTSDAERPTRAERPGDRASSRRRLPVGAAMVSSLLTLVAAGAGAQENAARSSELPAGKWVEQQWAGKDWTVSGYLSANIQWGSESGPSHQIGEGLLMINWEPVREDHRSGRLVVGLAHDQTFGHPTTRQFATHLGLVETPNDLDTDPKLTFTTLGLLLWEEERSRTPGRGWGFRAGQLYAPSYFGVAGFLDDDRQYFLARPLAAAGGAQWVGANDIGLGAQFSTWKDPFYFQVAAIDGKADRKFPSFSSLFDGQLLYLGEIGLQWDQEGPSEAAVRLTVSHLDVDDGEGPQKGPGQSLMLSGVRHFGGKWALCWRWSKSWKRLSSDHRELLSLGAMWLSPFSRSRDRLGLGLFAGEPSDAGRDVESGAEFFYRLQIGQAFHLTPDLQYWSTDGRGEGRTGVWVAGVRLNFEF